jgi:hypothetical protein
MNQPYFQQQQQNYEGGAHQYYQQQDGNYNLPPPKKQDESQVAMNLLQLKSNPENEGNEADHRTMQSEQPLEQQQQQQMHPHGQPPQPPPHHHNHYHVGYPPNNLMYGYPIYPPPPQYGMGHAPSLMEEANLLINIDDLIRESTLVVPKDRDLVPDALFVAMAQMKPCTLTQADRVGCYKARGIGFLGMCCKHCGGQPGFGRYFPNSVRSLAQTTTSHTILKHIGGKCRFCPPNIRKAVVDLQRQQTHKEGMASSRPRYGSRKIFFQRVWARLHDKGQIVEDAALDDVGNNQDDPALVDDDKETTTKLANAADDEEEDDDERSSSQTPVTEGINGEAGTSPRKRNATEV